MVIIIALFSLKGNCHPYVIGRYVQGRRSNHVMQSKSPTAQPWAHERWTAGAAQNGIRSGIVTDRDETWPRNRHADPRPVGAQDFEPLVRLRAHSIREVKVLSR